MKSDRSDLTAKPTPRLHFSDLAAALFGADSRAELTGRWIVFFITFCLALAVSLVIRRPDALFHPQFWAEDGNLLFYQQFYGESSLLKPYAGYLLLIPRAVARLADLFPVSRAPLIYNIFATVLASICSAWFALPYFRHIIRDDKLRVIVCILIALMPTAGTILLNLVNIQWYLHIWCCLVCLQPFPESKSKLAFPGIYLVCLFSSVLGGILIPVWILRAVLLRKDRAASIILAVIHGAYAAVIKTWLNPAPDNYNLSQSFNNIMTTIKLIITRVGMMSILGPKIMEYNIPHQNYIFIISGLILAGLILILIRRARFQPRFLIQTALLAYLIFSSVALLVLFRTQDPPEDLYFTVGGARYFIFATALFYLGLLNVLDKLKDDRWLKSCALIILLILGITVARHLFYVETFEDLQWPRWAAGLEQARRSQARFPADIPINPRPWVIPGSGHLPSDTVSLALTAEPQFVNQMERTEKGWRALGNNSSLGFGIKETKYIYAFRLRYALRGAGPPACQAQVHWRSFPEEAFRHDYKLHVLPQTKGEETEKMVWILDKLTNLQIEIIGPECDFKVLEILALASPHKI